MKLERLSSNLFGFFRGRVALREALAALDVGPGDEVAIQGYTCLAVPLPVVLAGAKPVFVDISPGNLGMAPDDLQRKLSDASKVVVVQHTFGVSPAVDRLREVAQSAGLPIISDRCHSILDIDSEIRDACEFYSFEWGKPIPAGVGGVLRVHPEQLELIRAVQEARRRFRPPALSARVMIELQYVTFKRFLTARTFWTLKALYKQLERIGVGVGTFREEELDLQETEEYSWLMSKLVGRRIARSLGASSALSQTHRKLASEYQDWVHELGLKTVPAFLEPGIVPSRFPIWAKDKAAVLRLAEARRVELSGMFRTAVDPLNNDQAARLGYSPGSCPQVERAVQSIVLLPIHNRIRPRQLERTRGFLEEIKDDLLEPAIDLKEERETRVPTDRR